MFEGFPYWQASKLACLQNRKALECKGYKTDGKYKIESIDIEKLKIKKLFLKQKYDT